MPPLLLLLLALACGTDPSNTDSGLTDPGPDPDAFMVVVLPDTQIYAWLYPDTFDAQLRWVAEHADEHNIVFVSHVGDIVQTGDALDQWDNAEAAYDWLEDIDMPHGFSVGAHDFSASGDAHDSSCMNFSDLDCDFTNFDARFGPARYQDRDWWGGASPSGRSSYQLVQAGGMTLLFLHLPQDTPRDEVDWAHEVLDANPGALAHLTTHRYLFDYRLTEAMPEPLSLVQAGRFNDATYLLGGQSLVFTDGVEAETLFTELVAGHPNIWGVHCGHVDAEYSQVSQNSAGLPVYEVLNDFQDMADGGGGWMRLLTFSPRDGTVHVQTWSPVSQSFRQNGDGFDHSIEILESYMGSATEYLAAFGLDEEYLIDLLEQVKTDTPLRQEYYDSLYGDGQRDSDFVLDVDFQAYIDASR